MPTDVDVEVRPATLDDVGAVRRIARRAWWAAHEPLVGEDSVETFLEEYYDVAMVQGRVERDDVVLLVASAGEVGVVGFLSAAPAADDPGLFHLSQCYVDPDRWGEGIGSRLLATAETSMADRGADRVRLGVMAENDRAVGFYEAAAYERVGAFHDDRLEVDGYTYEKTLG